MHRTAFTLILVAILAAACGQPVQFDPGASAQVHLAEALGIPAAQVAVLGSEAVVWPDSCLGIAYPNARCAQAVTPGYRVTLQAQGRAYRVHTNADGSAVALAVPSLTWHREGGIAGFCDDLFVTGLGEAVAGSCRSGENYPAGQLTAAELAQLDAWAAQFGAVVIEQRDPAVADAMTVILTMNGTGSAQPDEAEQQALLNWAQAVHARLQP